MIALLMMAALSATVAQAAPIEQACDFTQVLAAADYTRLVQERTEFAAPVLEAVDRYIFSISQVESILMELDTYELVEKTVRAKADESAAGFNDLTCGGKGVPFFPMGAETATSDKTSTCLHSTEEDGFDRTTVRVQKNGIVFTRRAVTPEHPKGHEFSVRIPFAGYKGMMRAREHSASKGVLAGLGTRKEFLAKARQHDESCELASARKDRHQAPRETEGFDKLIASLAPITIEARPEAIAQVTAADAR